MLYHLSHAPSPLFKTVPYYIALVVLPQSTHLALVLLIVETIIWVLGMFIVLGLVLVSRPFQWSEL
jgi:hypothetical protein